MKFIATSPAFIDGRRIRAGEKFDAPETFKARWAVPADKAVAAKPVPKDEPRTLAQANAQKAKTFTEAHAKDLA
jgi:hypothetical protein